MAQGSVDRNGSKVSIAALLSVAVSISIAFAGYAMHRVDTLSQLIGNHVGEPAHSASVQRAKDIERRLDDMAARIRELERQK